MTKDIFATAKKQPVFAVFFTAFFLFGLLIRIHNLPLYNTYWADDGGAHIQYIQTILEEKRLPSVAENYISWHEPLYYVGMAMWTSVGQFFRIAPLIDWQEIPGIAFGLLFACLASYLSYLYSKKNLWVALAIYALFLFLFPSVKLSAYVTNELPAQVGILLLMILFFTWKLLDPKKETYVALWSVLLAFVTLTKLTGVLVLFGAAGVWILVAITKKEKQTLVYAALSIFLVLLINAPWLVYKQQHFDSVFSINLHEQEKQSLISSGAWEYILSFNPAIFSTHPYWKTEPHSFTSILLADTFGDYYTLFNNVDLINALPEDERILTDSGRYTTSRLWRTTVWMNRIGGGIAFVWLVGLASLLISRLRQRQVDWYEFFLVIMMFGGFAALFYNNLRHPYLDRGVLKAAFVYFAYPLLAMFSYTWLWQRLPKMLWWIVVILPIVTYTVGALPILWV